MRLLLLSKSHPFALLPSFLHLNTPKCYKPNKAKEKKRSIKTTKHTSSYSEPNFISKKCYSPFGRTCPKGPMQHFSPQNIEYNSREEYSKRISTASSWDCMQTALCNGRVQSLHSFFEVFRGKKAASTGLHLSIVLPFLENLKAEAYYTTNRCDKRAPILHCCCDKAACAYFVAAICWTNSNQLEFVRQIAATKFNDFHMSHEVICCSKLSQWRVTTICRSECLDLCTTIL